MKYKLRFVFHVIIFATCIFIFAYDTSRHYYIRIFSLLFLFVWNLILCVRGLYGHIKE
jgi:hypothetical protein